MLKGIFGKSFGPSDVKPSKRARPLKVDLERIKALIEFFPIGKKLRYYPEFKQEIVFDTLVVAYCVNGGFVYSAEAIERDANGAPAVFRTGADDQRISVSAIHSFQFLVPDTSDLEKNLDYHRWGLIGRGRQFTSGNCISLISNAGGKGVSTVDTEVDKQVDLPDGPYAHSTMVLLTPDLTSLLITDQRKKSRTKLATPVTMSLLDGQFTGPCLIVDISDGELRIRRRERGTTMPAMQRGDEVIIESELGEAERRYFIKGVVIRRSTETCVVQLAGQFKDGKLINFTPLDLLELKAGLLNYGK